MKKILILEDSPERIKQYKQWFSNHEIKWYTNVNSFIKEETWPIHLNYGKYDLIIFDHDLGSYKYENGEILDEGLLAYDADGKSGYDAAKELESFIETPVLIWSYNKEGAKNIAAELAKKTKNKIYISPFSRSYDYKKMIIDILESNK